MKRYDVFITACLLIFVCGLMWLITGPPGPTSIDCPDGEVLRLSFTTEDIVVLRYDDNPVQRMPVTLSYECVDQGQWEEFLDDASDGE